MQDGQGALSPRLGRLVGGNAEIYDALLKAGLCTTQDLGTLGMDVDTAAKRFGLSLPARAVFADIYVIAKAKSDGRDEERMAMELDVLNAEGDIIMTRPRCDVHSQGFWHRVVHVWVVCPSTQRVLLGQRAVSKEIDPHRWTCACGRVPAGELSMTTAVARLATEFSIHVDPGPSSSEAEEISLIFRMKCPREMETGIFAGQFDGAWVDVYTAILDEEIAVERLHLSVRDKQAAKYVTLQELETAYASSDPNYVMPMNPEYTKRLLHYMKKACNKAQLAPLPN
mmetsp:Transcript_37975/g.80741  ORF Transcript_37975/g.80741 Transcript_37975/m.80741 type:complete len:283 (+) Transcript_37975:71-919(+)